MASCVNTSVVIADSAATTTKTATQVTLMGSITTATGQTGANAQAVTTAQEANQFTGNLMRNVTNNMASAVVSSAINGKPLNEPRNGS